MFKIYYNNLCRVQRRIIQTMDIFIPKQYKTEPVTLRIDLNKLKQIDKLANKYNLSRSAFINQCIDYAIKNMPKEE